MNSRLRQREGLAALAQAVKHILTVILFFVLMFMLMDTIHEVSLLRDSINLVYAYIKLGLLSIGVAGLFWIMAKD